MGHEVLTCGMRPHLEYHIPQSIITLGELLSQLPGGFTPDRIVWHDHSGPITVLGLEDAEAPCLMYSVDTHHHHLRHAASALGFDHVCVAQRDLMHHFADSQTPTSWLPLWASEYVECSQIKKHGAVFVGTLNAQLNPRRVEFFETLRQMIPIEVLEGHFPSIFPHAEIVLNQTVKGDLNFRVFEAMMCGALLLTERSGNGLLELFEDGTHLVTYTPNDPLDAADKVRTLLSNPTLMRAIAHQGREEILAKHTSLHRAQRLEAILRTLRKRERTPHRHYGAMTNLFSISTSAEQKNMELSGYTSAFALRCALRGLRDGAIPSDFTTSSIINACLRHDILFRDGLGARTISEFADALPDTTIFSLLKLRSLLNSGKEQEARTLALTVHKDICVEDTFLLAEKAATFLIEQLPMKM
jgi:hypothetical protein